MSNHCPTCQSYRSFISYNELPIIGGNQVEYFWSHVEEEAIARRNAEVLSHPKIL